MKTKIALSSLILSVFFLGTTSVFAAPEATEPEETTTSSPLEVLSAVANTETLVKVLFNQSIVLPKSKPMTAFTIEETNNAVAFISVLSAEIDPENQTAVLLTTESLNPIKKYMVTAGVRVHDISGNPILSGNKDTALFSGEKEPEKKEETIEEEPLHDASSPESTTEEETKTIDPPVEKDITPPEEVTELTSSYTTLAQEFLVKLGWKASINTQKDLSNQRFYESLNDGNTFSPFESLGKDSTSVEKKYQKESHSGKKITYKISTVDTSGNESTGAITVLQLPQTGPQTFFLFVFIFCLLGGLGTLFFFRKQKE